MEQQTTHNRDEAGVTNNNNDTNSAQQPMQSGVEVPHPSGSGSNDAAPEMYGTQAYAGMESGRDGSRTSPAQAPAKEEPSLQNELWEWLKAIVVAIVLVVIVQMFLISPFIVSGSSMEPNFHDRQRMIVNKLIYHLRTPERGEVIVFLHSDGRDFIKRVIGLPGDTVRVEGDQVYLNGQPVGEAFLDEIYAERHKNNEMWNIKDMADFVVPEGHVFVMGDNRSDSLDSRDIGPVDLSQIVGRSDLVYWPLNNFHLVQHPPLEPITK